MDFGKGRTVSPDWTTPISYFSNAAISNRHISWANGELYAFQMNERNNLQTRDLSTVGFRIFAQPVNEQLDYEIESIYQTGEVGRRNHFSHPHLGAVGYSFGTDWPFRFVCLFDYSSDDSNPSKHFNFLFANDAQNTNQPEFFDSSFHPISFTCWILLANRPPTVKLREPHRTFGMAVVLLWEAVCSTRPGERVPSSVIHSIRRDI